MIVASIMTGTSVDGVDISVVDTKANEIISFFSFDFNEEEIKYIERFLWPSKANLAEISEFNFKFSKIVSKYFNKMDNEVIEKIQMVVNHGQTVFHDIDGQFTKIPNTMQLGNGAVIAHEIKKDVLCDLRSSDVANGQQGAPIVAFGDKELFYKNKPVVIFNIGGISNATIIKSETEMITSDLGPGNALIDAYVKKNYNIPFDKNGAIASSGKVIKELLNELMKDPFIYKDLPKSTGKEVYNINYVEKLLKEEYDKKDIVCTLTEFTSQCMGQIAKLININDYEFMIAGGGWRNKTMMKSLKKIFPNIKPTDEMEVPTQARESAAFAYFAQYWIDNKRIGTGKNKSIFGCLYKY